VCATVTTTRKVFSVLLSIFLKGHSMSPIGWVGLSLASGGILSELMDKKEGHGGKESAKEGSDKKKK
jgi:UDP-galactose transporter B1